ncbi:MAG: hypothetical protein QW052_06240 [Candidatus Nitrosocaldaceae archaeon]
MRLKIEYGCCGQMKVMCPRDRAWYNISVCIGCIYYGRVVDLRELECRFG